MLSDGAVAVIVSGAVTIVTMVVGFLTLWIKLKYGVERKVDHNTFITKAATASAVSNAKIAADTASVAANKADEIAAQLNGKLEERVTAIVLAHTKPVIDTLNDHIKQDDKNMDEIRGLLNLLVEESGRPK